MQGNIKDVDLTRQKSLFYNLDISIHMGKKNSTIYVQIAKNGFSTVANKRLSDGSFVFEHNWVNVPACEIDLQIERMPSWFGRSAGSLSSYYFPWDRYYFHILIASSIPISDVIDPYFHVTEPQKYSWNIKLDSRNIDQDQGRDLLLLSQTQELYNKLEYFALYTISFYRVNAFRLYSFYIFPTELIFGLLVFMFLLILFKDPLPSNLLTVTIGTIFFLATFIITTEDVFPPTKTIGQDLLFIDLIVAFFLSIAVLWKGRHSNIYSKKTK